VAASDPELKKVADAYAKLRRDEAANQRAVAAAAKAMDEKKMEELEKKGEATSKTEDELTDKLEKLCE
jgi:predicted  nucleic acid-binding Zn-ribbon protein